MKIDADIARIESAKNKSDKVLIGLNKTVDDLKDTDLYLTDLIQKQQIIKANL